MIGTLSLSKCIYVTIMVYMYMLSNNFGLPDALQLYNLYSMYIGVLSICIRHFLIEIYDGCTQYIL